MGSLLDLREPPSTVAEHDRSAPPIALFKRRPWIRRLLRQATRVPLYKRVIRPVLFSLPPEMSLKLAEMALWVRPLCMLIDTLLTVTLLRCRPPSVSYG